jgi:hypothetical protein
LRYRNNLYHDEYLRPQMGSNMATVGWDKYYLGSVAMETHKKAPSFTPSLAQRAAWGGERKRSAIAQPGATQRTKLGPGRPSLSDAAEADAAIKEAAKKFNVQDIKKLIAVRRR